MTRPRSYVPVLHTHTHWSKRIAEADIEDALPDGAVRLLRPFELHSPHETSSATTVDWRREQLEQARWYEGNKHAMTGVGRDARLAYFGATWIPLAMDLGNRLRSFLAPEVYDQHHVSRRWGWRGREDFRRVAPSVTVTGLPELENPRAGSVLIRVSASYDIRPEKTRRLLPDAVAEVDIRLDPVRIDPFDTPEQLEAVVHAFGEVLHAVHTRVPNATQLDIALAGPPGLALRIGGSINPTIFPPVYAWQHDAHSSELYTRALILGRSIEALTMQLTILFLSADQSGTLAFDEEHRDIKQRLLEGTHRERFRLETALALEVRNFISVVDRARPSILHFTGHGDPTGRLYAAHESRSVGMRPEAVADALKELNTDRQMKLVVLNACDSHILQDAILARGAVDHVIATTAPVLDDVAVAFAAELYRALGDAKPLARAFAFAKLQCQMLPFHKRPPPDLFSLRSLPGCDPETTYLTR